MFNNVNNFCIKSKIILDREKNEEKWMKETFEAESSSLCFSSQIVCSAVSLSADNRRRDLVGMEAKRNAFRSLRAFAHRCDLHAALRTAL